MGTMCVSLRCSRKARGTRAVRVVTGWINLIRAHGYSLMTTEKPEDHRSLGTRFKGEWPKVVLIEQNEELRKKGDASKGSLAPEFPEIQLGCKLVAINGRPTPDKPSDAKPMMGLDRPHRRLRLTFSMPEQPRRLAPWPTVQWPSAERSDKPTDFRVADSGYKRKQNERWVQAGLPRWIEAGLEGVEMVNHEKSRTDEAVERENSNRSPGGFTKQVTLMAAKDAFRDAIALVRAHEDKSSAGIVAQVREPET